MIIQQQNSSEIVENMIEQGAKYVLCAVDKYSIGSYFNVHGNPLKTFIAFLAFTGNTVEYGTNKIYKAKEFVPILNSGHQIINFDNETKTLDVISGVLPFDVVKFRSKQEIVINSNCRPISTALYRHIDGYISPAIIVENKDGIASDFLPFIDSLLNNIHQDNMGNNVQFDENCFIYFIRRGVHNVQ